MTSFPAGSMEFGNVSLHRDQKVCAVQKELHGGVVASALPLCKLPVSTAKPLQGRNK